MVVLVVVGVLVIAVAVLGKYLGKGGRIIVDVNVENSQRYCLGLR